MAAAAALHEIESWDEALARSSRGRLVAGFGEWLRRAVDLEHWAAFRASFDRLTKLFGRIGRGEHGATPPATICVLSGDVHHTYTAVAAYPDQPQSKVVQITCSPFHNTIPLPMRIVFRFGWSSKMEFVMKVVMRLSVRHPSKDALEIFAREIAAAGTSWSPGTTGAGGSGRPRSSPSIRRVQTIVELDLTGLPQPTV